MYTDNKYLNIFDLEKVKVLDHNRLENNRIAMMLSNYLNQTPCMITKEIMDQVNTGGYLSEEIMYFSLLTGFLGLDTESNAMDKQLANTYLRRSVRRLDIETYARNPYYRNIRIPEEESGKWALKYEVYRPYEAFIYNDIITTDDFIEIPRVGFFSEPFRFPAVMEDGQEWMAIKPNEIETMQPVIDNVEGQVVTFGLGLGYFAYMASLKTSVSSVTVVEHDEQVIQLFKRYILPQFADPGKVEIIQSDVFKYIENQMAARHFDHAFVDLWHDASGGLPYYLTIKQLAHKLPGTRFSYWIEDSILSRFRWEVYDWVVSNARNYREITLFLGNPLLKEIIAIGGKISSRTSA